MLRAWSQSEWPRDGFTLEDNFKDLQRHEREHMDRKAFTFTIMNPEETFCLGCIYINPQLREEQDLIQSSNLGGDDESFIASVRFWVRESLASHDFNKEILAAILEWLRTAWYFHSVVFPVAIAETMQNRLFNEMGIGLMGELVFDSQKSGWKVYQKAFS